MTTNSIDVNSTRNILNRWGRSLLLVGLILLTLGQSLEANPRKRRGRGRHVSAVSLHKANYPPELSSVALDSLPTDSIITTLIGRGEALLGLRYGVRGIAPWGLDCSGYIGHLFRSMGIHVPRSSRDLSLWTERVDDARPGDLVFFTGRSRRGGRVGHVALVVDNSDGDLTIMHSTNSRGIIKHKLKDSQYFRSRYLFTGRIPQLSGRL